MPPFRWSWRPCCGRCTSPVPLRTRASPGHSSGSPDRFCCYRSRSDPSGPWETTLTSSTTASIREHGPARSSPSSGSCWSSPGLHRDRPERLKNRPLIWPQESLQSHFWDDPAVRVGLLEAESSMGPRVRSGRPSYSRGELSTITATADGEFFRIGFRSLGVVLMDVYHRKCDHHRWLTCSVLVRKLDPFSLAGHAQQSMRVHSRVGSREHPTRALTIHKWAVAARWSRSGLQRGSGPLASPPVSVLAHNS